MGGKLDRMYITYVWPGRNFDPIYDVERTGLYISDVLVYITYIWPGRNFDPIYGVKRTGLYISDVLVGGKLDMVYTDAHVVECC